MQRGKRIERAVEDTLARFTSPTTPPRLRAALHHAVFPGGARLRPHLAMAVAEACGATQTEQGEEAALAAAVALELMHCASLVHDDLPCFDDAATRRGQPSVHASYGEPLAVLVGDGLIVMAFQALTTIRDPRVMAPLVGIVGEAVGSSRGIVAGQAWECEPRVGLGRYHQAKTGALFEAAARAGAIAAGRDPEAWAPFGAAIGEAYQVADDLHDALGSAAGMGKPAGRDAVLGRPSAVQTYGVDGAVDRLRSLLDRALESVPSGIERRPLDAWLSRVASRLLPTEAESSSSQDDASLPAVI